MKFKLGDYCIASIRDGQSEHKKDEAIENMDANEILIVYRHDVYTHYYAVPFSKKEFVGNQLLEFFYDDNYDYTDEQLKDFKELYPQFFKAQV
jgi:hypothetical protein